MLPKCHRLTRSRDFLRVRRQGRSCGSALLVLYVLPTHTAQLRVGLSVSKRVGKATVRNRVKRLIREAVRHQTEVIRPGHDLLFIARSRSSEATYQQIVDTVAHLLEKSRTTVKSSAGSSNA